MCGRLYHPRIAFVGAVRSLRRSRKGGTAREPSFQAYCSILQSILHTVQPGRELYPCFKIYLGKYSQLQCSFVIILRLYKTKLKAQCYDSFADAQKENFLFVLNPVACHNIVCYLCFCRWKLEGFSNHE